MYLATRVATARTGQGLSGDLPCSGSVTDVGERSDGGVHVGERSDGGVHVGERSDGGVHVGERSDGGVHVGERSDGGYHLADARVILFASRVWNGARAFVVPS